MSVLIGIFGEPLPDDALVAMLSAMDAGFYEHRQIARRPGATLAVARPEWQMAEGMSCGELVVERDGLVVIADASLYYREDLRRALTAAGVPPEGNGPASLILAAYRAWGDQRVERLEGDWTFIVWDAAQRTAFAARDFAGRRQLHYAVIGGTLVVATRIGGVLAFPGCPTALNLVSIAETASSLLASSHETCYQAIQRLGAGFAMRSQQGSVALLRHWAPRPREGASKPDFIEGAIHLRGLLSRATEARLGLDGPTSIQLSGGWDSTSIFAVGSELLRSRESSQTLLPVSISYPVGDSGREDEIIEMILDRWNASTRWVDIAEIPLFDHPETSAAGRDEPLSHVYEHWNRRLVREGRALGTRVMLDGFGGDSLFQSSSVHLADLLRSGRLLQLRREWKAKRMRGWNSFLSSCIVPLLPLPLLHTLHAATGSPRLRPKLERELPRWMDRRFAREHDLLGRERANTPRYGEDTSVSDELYWHLTNPWISRTLALNYEYGLQEGVEIRSPLFDRRVVEFAVDRPWSERTWRRETKRLLRESVRGLLPDDVLAPRRYRTGMTTGYLQRKLREALPQFGGTILREPLLAELGIVDPSELTRAIEHFIRHGDLTTGVQLFFTLQSELWLRGHAMGADRLGQVGVPALSA